MKREIGLLSISLMGLVWVYCTSVGPTANGGSGTETTTGITATALYPNGTPAAYATVHLRKSDFVTRLPAMSKSAAIIGADAFADDSGRFEISGLAPGNYCIEVTDGRSSSVLLACTLAIKDTADLGTAVLRPFATVIGSIDTAGRVDQQAYVQIEGLERLVVVSSDGSYSVADLPGGAQTVHVVEAGPTGVTALQTGEVIAIAGDTSIVPSILPAPWQSAPIGNESPRGDAAFVNGQFVVSGGGPDIFWTRDDFHFVYRPLAGNGEIIARLVAFKAVYDSTANNPKAGVMIRESLDPASANAAASFDYRFATSLLQWRETTSDNSTCSIFGGFQLPVWLRMVRQDSLFIKSVSDNGTTWTGIDTATIHMKDTLFVGLAVTGGNIHTLGLAKFDSVSVK